MSCAVNRLVLKRFLSVPSGLLCFDHPTFLMGRNDAGKSNLCKAFRFQSPHRPSISS